MTMRRTLLLLAALLVLSTSAMAQYDDRDGWANDPTSAAAGAYQAKRSLQSLGSNDMSSWTVPARTNSGAWTQQRVSSNHDITIRVPQRRVSRTAQQQAAKRAQRDADHEAWLESRRAQIEAANEERQQRAEERRRRIAAENAADRKAGYERHLKHTSGYYRSQQSRDRAMAIEAHRIDEQYTARRFATPPSTQSAKVETMANDDLAALLEPVPAGTLVYRDPALRRQGNIADVQQGQMAITNEQDYDTEILQRWQSAGEATNLLRFSHQRSEHLAQEPILLLSHEEFAVDSATLFILPSYGLVMPVGDSLLILKDRSLNALSWQDGRRYSSAFACGDWLIGRQGATIYPIEATPQPPLLEFDTEEYALFAGDDGALYGLFWYEQLTSLYRFDLSTKQYEEVVRLPLPMWKVVANEHRRFVLVDDEIYQLNDKGEPTLFYRSAEPICDLDFSPWGLLLTTESEVIRILSPTQTETFYPYGAYQLWIDGNEVYLLDCNCDLLLIPDGATVL